MLVEYLVDRGIGGAFDLGIGVREREAEAHGKPLADRRFARAHHADENDRPIAKPLDDRAGPGRTDSFRDRVGSFWDHGTGNGHRLPPRQGNCAGFGQGIPRRSDNLHAVLRRRAMLPTLIRLFVAAVIVAIIAAIAILALAYLVNPVREETIIEVPLGNVVPSPAPAAMTP
jgi:hypothetical protein